MSNSKPIGQTNRPFAKENDATIASKVAMSSLCMPVDWDSIAIEARDAKMARK